MSEPTLALPASVSGGPGDFIEVTATLAGPNVGQTVRWHCPDGLHVVPPSMLRDTRVAVFVAEKPGTYEVMAWAAAGNEPTECRVCQVIVREPAPTPDEEPDAPVTPVVAPAKVGVAGWVGIAAAALMTLSVIGSLFHGCAGPAPGPNPPPQPGPPAPVVGSKAVWAVAVTDKSAPLDDASKVLLSATLRKSLEGSGHTLRWYDAKQPYAQGLGKQIQAAGGVPALVVLEKGGANDGKVLSAVRLPSTEAAFLDAIHKAGGK